MVGTELCPVCGDAVRGECGCERPLTGARAAARTACGRCAGKHWTLDPDGDLLCLHCGYVRVLVAPMERPRAARDYSTSRENPKLGRGGPKRPRA